MYVYSMLFADDQEIMAGDEYDIEYTMRKLNEACEENGVKINNKKTKYLVVGGKAPSLQINGCVIRRCEYKYLGTVIKTEGNSRKDITKIIIGQAGKEKLNSLIWSKRLEMRRFSSHLSCNRKVVPSILIYVFGIMGDDQ